MAIRTSAPPAEHGRRSRAKKPPLRGVVSVLGELLITAGILLMLFVVWELWWTDIEANQQQDQVAAQLFESFAPATGPAPVEDFGDPVVGAPAAAGEAFAMMYIPRFGADYARPVSSGVGLDVLNTVGIGHYPDTAMPGAVGNFAVAGHRQTHGAVFGRIDTLVPGDKIYVQTKDGYYIYVHRSTEIVQPDRMDVLAPVPTRPGVEATERMLTMTSCHPLYSTRERIIAYSVLESWQPASAGPPAAIADQVAAAAQKSGQ